MTPESQLPGALILSGGRSSRMGSPKALYKWKGATFLERIVTAYHDVHITSLLLVTHAKVAEHPDFHTPGGVELLVLPEVTPSPLHTLWKGLERMEHRWPAFFMHPVDFPFVRSRTLHAMASAFRSGTAKIVQPRYGNRGGHPVLIHMSLAQEIRKASPEKGLREVVRRDPDRVHRLTVEDPGVAWGINHPSDLKNEPPPSGNRSR